MCVEIISKILLQVEDLIGVDWRELYLSWQRSFTVRRFSARTEISKNLLRDDVTCLAISRDFFITGHISGIKPKEYR